MEVKLKRGENPVEVKYLTVLINGESFRLEEDNEGNLVITKSYESIIVMPCVANQIKIK
ncbi:hypothetical protein F132_15 [Flavobacterium sp. phage 1/32]|nr:hypothetical protein F132_15 [Flavobacterium sp. phage 1/32]